MPTNLTPRPEQKLTPIELSPSPARGYTKYLYLRLSRTWQEFRRRFSGKWEFAKSIFALVLAILFTHLLLGREKMSEQLWEWLGWSFLGAVVLRSLEAVYDFLRVPYLLHKESVQKINQLEEERRELEQKHVRKLEEVTNKQNRYFYKEVLPEETSKLKDQVASITAERDSLRIELEEKKEQLHDRADRSNALEALTLLYQEGEELRMTTPHKDAKTQDWIGHGTVIIRKHLGEPYGTEFLTCKGPSIMQLGEHFLDRRLELLMKYMKRLREEN